MTRIVGFNYEALDAGVRSETQENAQAIRGLVRQATASVIEIGKRHFGAWLRAEFRWSQSVASNYMLAATKFGNLDEYVINNIHPLTPPPLEYRGNSRNSDRKSTRLNSSH